MSMNETNEITLTKQEAFVSVLLMAVAIDGDISEVESQTLSTMMSRMKLFQGFSDKQFGEALQKLMPMIDKHGHKAVFGNAAEVLPKELRETAFALATDLIFINGRFSGREATLIEEIKTSFSVPTATATKIVEVMSIKCRA